MRALASIVRSIREGDSSRNMVPWSVANDTTFLVLITTDERGNKENTLMTLAELLHWALNKRGIPDLELNFHELQPKKNTAVL